MKAECDRVYHDVPESITKLARELEKASGGRLKKQFYRGLALTMAYTVEGRVYGHWGSCAWTHENGQFDTGTVRFEWND